MGFLSAPVYHRRDKKNEKGRKGDERKLFHVEAVVDAGGVSNGIAGDLQNVDDAFVEREHDERIDSARTRDLAAVHHDDDVDEHEVVYVMAMPSIMRLAPAKGKSSMPAPTSGKNTR